jgi:carbon-monoxide dehydrogenase small subunit
VTIPVRIRVNGSSREHDVEPRLLLVHYLRDTCGLTGTHIGCETSICGACTVLVDGQAVKACTMLAVQADGSDITTIEGLSTREESESSSAAARARGSPEPALGVGPQRSAGSGAPRATKEESESAPAAGAGVGPQRSHLHAVQQGFWECHGAQCGFCTPGMIMAAVQLLERNPVPSRPQIAHALRGNLCRCTGYSHIIDAVEYAAKATAPNT